MYWNYGHIVIRQCNMCILIKAIDEPKHIGRSQIPSGSVVGRVIGSTCMVDHGCITSTLSHNWFALCICFAVGLFPGTSGEASNNQWGVAKIGLQSPVIILIKCMIVTVHLGCFKGLVNPGPSDWAEVSSGRFALSYLYYGIRFTCSHLIHGHLVQTMGTVLIACCDDNCLGHLLHGLDTGDAK